MKAELAEPEIISVSDSEQEVESLIITIPADAVKCYISETESAEDGDDLKMALDSIEHMIEAHYSGQPMVNVKNRRDIWFKSVLRSMKRFAVYLME